MSTFDDFMIDDAVKKDQELDRLRSDGTRLRAEIALLRETVLAAIELTKHDGHSHPCAFRGCTCGNVQAYKNARTEFLRRLRKLNPA